METEIAGLKANVPDKLSILVFLRKIVKFVTTIGCTTWRLPRFDLCPKDTHVGTRVQLKYTEIFGNVAMEQIQIFMILYTTNGII